MADQQALEKKLLENLQQNFHQLATEAKKKHPPLKEAAEAGIVKVRAVSIRKHNIHGILLSESGEILEPFFMGCDTKSPKIVQISLTAIQRFITFEAVSEVAANNLINCLWNLMESSVEEVKVLQTITLLISTNQLVRGDALAKALSLCFRLHFTKNMTTNNTASATIRQLVAIIFERVQTEQCDSEETKNCDLKLEELKPGRNAPKSLRPAAADAFLFFQDLIQLVDADQPFWLTGLTEMTRTFGLELLELIFTSFPEVFYKHQEFAFVLKERICQLVIKLFSPNIKQRPGATLSLAIASPAQTQSQDKPFWPITVRLMRIVAVLIQKFYTMLITESEIFFSLLIKSLEADKPNWQRSIALEALYKMIQPNLISCLCRFYDMKPQSSKIFRDIVNALCIYIQSQFLYIDSTTSQSLIASIVNSSNQNPTNSFTNQQPSSNVTPQPAFMLRGVWIPLLYNISKGNYKPFFIEQLDKLEAPSAPDGHGLTSSFACLLQIINSTTKLIDDNKLNETNSFQHYVLSVKNLDEETKFLNENLLNSSWCGFLGCLSLLLDASTDESITELILKTMQRLAGLYGLYGLDGARDAVLTSICKSSLPPHYSIPILTAASTNEILAKTEKHNSTQANDTTTNINISNLLSQQNSQLFNTNIINNDSSDTRQQVVAVGTPLSANATPQSSQQGPVMLTSKNLQCMKALLNVACTNGMFLEEKSWLLILTTLQHLVWILGLKPNAGGALKAGRVGTEAGASTNTLVTTAAMSDLPVLSAMLSKLFESSQFLPEESLLHLVNALVKLSQESMEIALNNREPSLFAVAKLLETGIVNLHRIDSMWKPITSHLIEVCQHPHLKMRELGVEAICSLVKTALSQFQNQIEEKEENSAIPTPSQQISTVQQFMILAALQDLSYNSHQDIRQKQLDCALQILQSSGDILSHGWPQIFEIVGAINDSQNENLIRSAFQCLQLIIADFLTSIPSLCLILCIDTTAKFASQNQELNVSLTAIGLLWNIADNLYSNQEKIKLILNETDKTNLNKTEESLAFTQLSAFDCLWMGVFTRLGDLCTDSRSSVRKSAAQTLFSTLGNHGSILESKTWHSVLWTVLFPLLERVRTLSESASSDKIVDSKSMGSETSGNILLHHSRNTAQKQWAETQVLVLSGVSRIFVVKRDVLIKTENFEQSWSLLFKYIENSSLNKNSEVSLSALKCFQDVLSSSKAIEQENNQIEALWESAWDVWVKVGMTTSEFRKSNEVGTTFSDEIKSSESYNIPSQAFLTSHIQMFPYLFTRVKHKFTESNFIKLTSVLLSTLSVPLANSDISSVYILSTTVSDPITPLQESVLQVMDTLQKDILADNKLHFLLPSLFNLLLAFSCFSVNVVPQHLPIFDTLKNIFWNKQIFCDSNGVNPNIFCTFGEKASKNVLTLYQQTANNPIVIESNVLNSIIKTFKIPLCLKYSCPSQTTWKLSVSLFLSVLQVGLPITRQHPNNFKAIWGDLALAFDGFLFPTSKPPPNQTIEEQQLDESLDVKMIELIRDYIMPFSSQIPKEFLLQTVSLLNRGSIHSATSNSPVDTESTRKLREEFARTCFETLLQFSFLGPTGNPGLFIQSSSEAVDQVHQTASVGIVNKLAVTSILQRFNDVVLRFVEDEKICPCPLPRHRMAEISFVLKALSTLMSSLRKAPPSLVEPEVWQLLIGLYPFLVDCTTSNSVQVTRPLKEVLHQYYDLLRPPVESQPTVGRPPTATDSMANGR